MKKSKSSGERLVQDCGGNPKVQRKYLRWPAISGRCHLHHIDFVHYTKNNYTVGSLCVFFSMWKGWFSGIQESFGPSQERLCIMPDLHVSLGECPFVAGYIHRSVSPRWHLTTRA